MPLFLFSPANYQLGNACAGYLDASSRASNSSFFCGPPDNLLSAQMHALGRVTGVFRNYMQAKHHIKYVVMLDGY
jgi:hypothetical protein